MSAEGLVQPESGELDTEALLELGPPSGPVCIVVEALVHVELPPGGLQLRIPISAEQGGHSSGGQPGPGEEEQAGPSSAPEMAAETTFAAGKPVLYLPPIRLTLRLPPGYPSAGQPPFVEEVQALWLMRPQAAALEAALQLQWQEEQAQGGGGPIIYLWVEWLKQSALAHIGGGASDSLTVRPQEGLPPIMMLRGQSSEPHDDGGQASCSSRAPAGGASATSATAAAVVMQKFVSAEEVAMHLLRYAASRSLEAFQQQSLRWDPR